MSKIIAGKGCKVMGKIMTGKRCRVGDDRPTYHNPLPITHYPLPITRYALALLLALALAIALAGCGGGGGNEAVNTVVNAPATPQPDAFNWMGNTRLTVLAANGLLANDSPGAVIASADATTSQGGAVSVNLATGAFTYDPPLGLQNAADTFSYRVTGQPPTTVTITLAERIWYVRNNDAGANQGNDRAPFLTLAQAQNVSDANDIIFVFAGDLTVTGQNGGITLKNGQRLLGEGVGLTVNGLPLVDPIPNALISNAGLAPAAGNVPVVMLATGNEVAGFSIQAAFNEGILAVDGGGHNLHDNVITFDAAGGREGIRLLNVTGNNSATANIITGSPRNGILVANNEDQAGNIVAATPVITTVTMSRNVISAAAQDGIRVNLDGAGTGATLQILTNTISNSGSAGANEGININALGAAGLKAVVSRNTISGSSAEAIDLAADGASSLDAFVANNALSVNAGLADFRAAIAGASTAVIGLELMNNKNANIPPNSTFRVENNPGIAASFRLFEQGNDNLATRIGPITDAAQGVSGVVLAGAPLFEANCSICHRGNGLGHGNVGPNITNATAAMINLQLVINPTMRVIKLTQQEVQAIAAALVAVP